MKSSQWFAFAIVLLVMTTGFRYIATNDESSSAETTQDILKYFEKAIDEEVWSEGFSVALLNSQNSANALWISSNINFSLSRLFLGISLACLICGIIEQRAEKKKKKRR